MDQVLLMMQPNQHVIQELFWIVWHILLFISSVEQLAFTNQLLGLGLFVFF